MEQGDRIGPGRHVVKGDPDAVAGGGAGLERGGIAFAIGEMLPARRQAGEDIALRIAQLRDVDRDVLHLRCGIAARQDGSARQRQEGRARDGAAATATAPRCFPGRLYASANPPSVPHNLSHTLK